MRKVTTINLNGRAYQLEEQGYESLQKYLHKAEAALADDPDKADVIVDLEQAIADKCERLLKDGKNVVTTEQIENILMQMGAVESGDAEGVSDTKSDFNKKRLYVIREGSVIMGVCRGIAVYLGIDVVIVRILAVALLLLTHGFAVLVYILLGIILPEAKTEADIDKAYGKPTRAQDIVEQVRERASDPETVRKISDGTMRVFRIVSKVIGVILAVLVGIFTSAWLWLLWQQMLGRFDLHGNLQMINGWRAALAITLVYLVIALPPFLLFRIFDRFGEDRKQSKASTISEVTLAITWWAAVFGVIMFATTYAGSVRNYANDHKGKLDIGNSHICVDANKCNVSDAPQRIYYHFSN